MNKYLKEPKASQSNYLCNNIIAMYYNLKMTVFNVVIQKGMKN